MTPKLPSELFEMIADRCDMATVQNLRLAGLWAEKYSHISFGRRVSMNIKLDLSQRGARSFVPETLADTQRASWHSEAEVPYDDYDRDAPSYVVRLRQHPSLTFDVLAAGQLLAELPNLQDLQLQGLSIESLQSQLDLGAIEALREAKGFKSKIRTLKVQCSLLTKNSLEDLIRYLGPGLTHLTMRFIASADGGWHDVFPRIGELGLDRFVWENLQYARNLSQEEKDGGAKEWQDVTVLDFRQRFDSYHEGYHHVVADSTSMGMYGRNAVEFGIPWALERLR
ncbi:hypothetical protein LTS10_000849 [Elasticomyces elasticus]|nr:hypothetical protein LTS10_000849 [Elasticomyces elasticus]